MKYKTIAILVAILLGLIILFQNTQVVTLKVLLWEITMSQIILTITTMVIGFVVGFIVTRLLTKPHSPISTEKVTTSNAQK
ncbi:MAG: LapA family protein [Deltaproteobacteria bacterium]|nr:LapA family protein [Deltaproteobacteria bacterium]MBW1952123.1 LapA family protein [Deltaproteobacteria bacterium]MBW1986188.1 LapA family protein [Deltaproteobacteria bacterium]MBW2134942.1 LapA family protein [Deltaproteobacteria bacterium]